MRVLVAIAPALYRQTIALFISGRRPGVEVGTADPADLERECAVFQPDLLVCHEAAPEVRKSAFSRVEIRYSNGLDALVSVGGRDSGVEDIEIEDLLAVLDETARLVSGR